MSDGSLTPRRAGTNAYSGLLGSARCCETGPTGMRSRDPNICIPTEPDDSPPSIHDLHLGAARYMDDVLARTSLACRAFSGCYW